MRELPGENSDDIRVETSPNRRINQSRDDDKNRRLIPYPVLERSKSLSQPTAFGCSRWFRRSGNAGQRPERSSGVAAISGKVVDV